MLQPKINRTVRFRWKKVMQAVARMMCYISDIVAVVAAVSKAQ